MDGIRSILEDNRIRRWYLIKITYILVNIAGAFTETDFKAGMYVLKIGQYSKASKGILSAVAL